VPGCARARLASSCVIFLPPGAKRISQACGSWSFGLVGATGIVVNSAALWFFFHNPGLEPPCSGRPLAPRSPPRGTSCLVDTMIYRKRAHGPPRRQVRFFIMKQRLLLPALLSSSSYRRGFLFLVANAITLVLLFASAFIA